MLSYMPISSLKTPKQVSTENGAIVTNSARWPLIIDPQLQVKFRVLQVVVWSSWVEGEGGVGANVDGEHIVARANDLHAVRHFNFRPILCARPKVSHPGSTLEPSKTIAGCW